MSTGGNGRWWGQRHLFTQKLPVYSQEVVEKGWFLPSPRKHQYYNYYYLKNSVLLSPKETYFIMTPSPPKNQKNHEPKIVLPSLSLPPVVLFFLLSRAPELSVNKLSGLHGPVKGADTRELWRNSLTVSCQSARQVDPQPTIQKCKDIIAGVQCHPYAETRLINLTPRYWDDLYHQCLGSTPEEVTDSSWILRATGNQGPGNRRVGRERSLP